MKTLMIISTLFFSITFSTSAQEDKWDCAVVSGLPNNFKVIYTKEGQERVKIRIKNEEGKLMRVDKVTSNNGFMKRYDLTNLDAGNYSFELIDRDNKTLHSVQVTESTAKSEYITPTPDSLIVTVPESCSH